MIEDVVLAQGSVSPSPPALVWGSVGTGSAGHESPGQRFWSGQVGSSRVSVTDPVSDPVVSDPVSDPVCVAFTRAVYCCFWGDNTPPWNLWDCVYSVFLHCVLSIAAQCIVIARVCLFVCLFVGLLPR